MSQENNFVPNQGTYKPLTPFQLFVKSNFPFIENTFESLDNYGLYCKIVEYLNNVIENENTVEDNVTALYNAFVSLNTYVSNYFDNLDVQEEINNKLDDMVETGEMETLLSSVSEQYFAPLVAEQNQEITRFKNTINSEVNEIETKVDSVASGNPIPVSSTSDMTDTDRVYVNTSNGYWYYYNGTAWTQGGVYQSSQIPQNSVTPEMTTFIDKETSENLFNPATVRTGYFYSSGISVGDEPTPVANAAFSCNLVEIKPATAYIISGCSYDLTYYDENYQYLGQKTISSSTADVTIPSNHAYQEAKYIGISYRHATYPTATFMVIEGTEMPENYIEYFDPYYLLDDVKIDSSDIIDLSEKTYYVGPNRTIGSFISLIKAISTDETPKTIYIDAGTYDIFEEIGGSEFALSIEEGTNWKDCNPIIPNNTKVIGLGNVIFNFTPTDAEIGNIANKLLSPINVIGNIEMENITINALNCRYAIHDDGSADRTKDHSRHIYKNIKAHKGGSGYQQAFGGGIGNGSYFEFDNCEFDSSVSPCFSFHNQWYSLGGAIVIKNSIIKNQTLSIRIGSLSTSHPESPIIFDIDNTYINGPIKMTNEDGNPLRENPYKIRMLNSSNVTIDNSVFPNNPFTPEIYNI